MSDEKLQLLIADACLAGLEEEELEARAARLGVTQADVAALPPRRLEVYRRLVRNNLLGVATKMMPLTRARLNDLGEGAFDESFDAFLAERAPRTHYLRDVPAEFLAWVSARWTARADLPRYTADLAQHELVHFIIAAAPRLEKPPAVADLALERPLVFNPATRLVRYAHAVHTLPDDEADRSVPEARDVSLLVYRDAENVVRYLELTALAAQLASRLLEGAPLGQAVAGACAAEGTPLTPDVLAGTARMLADWGERGLLLGARAA